MKASEAIEALEKLDPDAELVWHDAIEGNDCPIMCFFTRNKNDEVLVSPLTEDQLKKSFELIENHNLK